MTTPNFELMTVTELRTYAIAHREDEQALALRELASMAGGVRGKYVERYRARTNIVLLEPDVAAAFPNAESVNTALRMLLNVAQRSQQNQATPAE
jgi:hypothetical protein